MASFKTLTGISPSLKAVLLLRAKIYLLTWSDEWIGVCVARGLFNANIVIAVINDVF